MLKPSIPTIRKNIQVNSMKDFYKKYQDYI